MKKFYECLVALTFFSCVAHAQVGEWVWLRGSNNTGVMGSFGTKGVSSPTNDPPALYEPCEFTDLSGNLWLFGGLDINGLGHADLWKYNPAINEWTWMKGPGTVSYTGSFGTKGVPSATNNPPAAVYCVRSWVDLQGNFWLYGGLDWNAIWKYDVSTNMWTWMQGSNLPSQPAVYGTKGVENPANTPGCRFETSVAWTDNAGDLWVFGGGGAFGLMNDLWRFNISTNSWTWMKGSSTGGQPSVYGTLGVEDTRNTPGGRYVYSRWKDNSGRLWLFDGWDGSNVYNDMWRYDPATNNWAWMGGSQVDGAEGVYGTKCIPSSSNFPGARCESRVAWTDTDGNLWLFGGGNDGVFSKVWNDLWKYCVAANKWVWVSGDSTTNSTANRGTMGVSSPSNKPDGRAGGIGWADQSGHLYFFGGSTTPYSNPYNDIWRFTIDTACSVCNVIPPAAALESSDSSICENDCISFTDLSSNATSWQWTFQGGLPSSSSDRNPAFVCYQVAGSYDVTLVAGSNFGSDTLQLTGFINAFATPVTPTITRAGSTLYCSTDTSYISYQWYKDSVLIPGATDTSLVISVSGNYNVQVTGGNGCKIAVGINIILGLADGMEDNSFVLSPNPVGNELRIEYAKFSIEQIDIYNVLGQICSHPESGDRKPEIEINVSALPPGIYFVHLKGDKESRVARFVKK